MNSHITYIGFISCIRSTRNTPALGRAVIDRDYNSQASIFHAILDKHIDAKVLVISSIMVAKKKLLARCDSRRPMFHRISARYC